MPSISLPKVAKFIGSFGFVETARVIDALELTAEEKQKLSLVYELCRRISVAKVYRKVIKSSSDAGEYLVKDMQFLNVEVFKMMFLNTGKGVIAVKEISRGKIDETPIYIREIVRHTLYYNAKKVVLAHNHVGGALIPSEPDIKATKLIKNALELCEIEIMDHIIVVDNSYFSFKEGGLL